MDFDAVPVATLYHIFDHARPGYDTADMARHRPASRTKKGRPRIPALSVQKLFKFLLFVADIFASACRPMSGRVISESDMVENVGIAAGIASKSYFYFRFWWPPF